MTMDIGFVTFAGGYVSRYSDFIYGEPSSAMTQCLSMDGNGGDAPYKWRESDCNVLKSYVCRIGQYGRINAALTDWGRDRMATILRMTHSN